MTCEDDAEKDHGKINCDKSSEKVALSVFFAHGMVVHLFIAI